MHVYLGGGLARGLMFVLCLLSAMTASAQPYELFAVYEPASGTGTTKAFRLKLAENALIPDGGESHVLDRIIVKFDDDGVSLSALSIFSQLRFRADVGGQKTETAVPTDSIGRLPSREHTLARWRGDYKEDAIVPVTIQVAAVYSGDFLCMQERELLTARDDDELSARRSTPPPIPLLPPDSTGQAQSRQQPGGPSSNGGARSVQRPLLQTGDGDFILYSLCRDDTGQLLIDPINWAKAMDVQEFQLGGSTTDSKLQADFRKAHKKRLAELLSDRLNKRFASFGRTVVTDTDLPGFKNVLIQVSSTFKFSVIKSTGALFLIEESGGDVQRLADLIDQDAEVAISLDRAVCAQLPPAALLNNPWTFELEVPDGKDGKTRKTKVELDFRHGCNRTLQVQWKNYLNQRVTFRTIYRVPGNDDIVVLKESFAIYNLGLITTVPVFTEIISAAQNSAPSDVEATSSIPVSYALPLNDRDQRRGSVAVTFPFTVSINTRRYHNLAEYIALAPSVSLIGGGYTGSSDGSAGGEDQGPNVRVALGMGINIARAFHFGYAWAPSDGGRYALIGISVPDLLPLLRKSP
ncbi:hypothetical protein [Corallococcus macrosporus]|uniref:Uncharacterized protein n=1 Tax=Corallococcus macrosporus DSM 14697 TaxID=1189310 RepID=A0A286NW65_9BACT|nr:hypothetical protein [Corallococcus macrosporus]ATB51410.1 hypothetical protein MYMAC_007073 [Corallococcus macrosporus DSM 14697]